MTLAGTSRHYDSAVEYLELTANLLGACRSYFTDSAPTMAEAMAVARELEARAAGPGHPSSALAKRWRTSSLGALARELRDGLAGVRLMVDSGAVAAGNAAAELGCCAAAPEESPVHTTALALGRRAAGTHGRFAELAGRLADVDGILRGLRAEPWSIPDRMVVELLRRQVTSGDLARAGRELAASAELLERVLAEVGPEKEKGPHAPVRARLSLLPSGPGEVHEMNAAWGPRSV